MNYDAADWHWIVAGDETRFWSGRGGAYVATLPEGAGTTRIANEFELIDVLVKAGRPDKAPPMPPAADRLVALASIDRAKVKVAGFTDDEIAGNTGVPDEDDRFESATDAVGVKVETDAARMERRLKALENRSEALRVGR